MRMAINYIKSDLLRYSGSTSLIAFIKSYLTVPAFRYQVAFRLIKCDGGLKLLGFVLWAFRNKKKIVLYKETQVGYGLYIGHGGPVVIHPTAVIGDNVNLSQFTTIGSNKGKAAKIGNNVYIGPNTCVVEDVTIGDNVTIGAGSVVTKNIPDNATAVGNYAKVINYNEPGKYIKNRWSN